MKHYLSKRLLALLFVMSVFCYDSLAVDFLPDDLPTAEVLIDLHKKIKKDEDEAMTRITTGTGLQSLIHKGVDKFKQSRDSLDSKLNNAYSYVILAGSLSTTANSMYKLIDEYKDFTVNTYKYVSKKPFVAWYYTNANTAIFREIKHCKNLYAMMAASGINVWRASMADKLRLVMVLHTSIENARAILKKANLYCYLVVNTEWKPDYIWEILTSDVKDEIIEGLVNKWNKGK